MALSRLSISAIPASGVVSANGDAETPSIMLGPCVDDGAVYFAAKESTVCDGAPFGRPICCQSKEDTGWVGVLSCTTGDEVAESPNSLRTVGALPNSSALAVAVVLFAANRCTPADAMTLG